MYAEDPGLASGRLDFVRYCSPCHGEDARGDGPLAARLEPPPKDLRLIAQRNGGNFPLDDLRAFVDGRTAVVAHNERVMPRWGEMFDGHNEEGLDPNKVVNRRIDRILRYVWTLQR